MSALADRRFRPFFLAQALSSFGDTAMYLAMAIWVKQLTGSSAAAGAVIFALTAGSLAGPMTGLLADRFRRLPLTIIVNLATGVVVLGLFGVHTRADIWIIYSVASLYGISLSLLSATRSGLVHDLLSDDLLGPANAILQTTAQGIQLAAPLVGAGLFTVVGGGPVAAIDAATFVIAALLLTRVHITETHANTERQSLFREVSAGLAYVRATAVLRQIVISELAMCAVLGFFEPITFAVVDQGLHRRPSFVGVLVTISGAGAIAAGLVVAALLRRLNEPRTYALALLLFALAALGQIPHNLVSVVVASMAGGAALTLANVAIATARQRYTPVHLQGRVAAVTNLTGVAQTLSIGVGAALLGLLDYRVLLAIMVVIFTGSALPPLIHPATVDVSSTATLSCGLSRSDLLDDPYQD